MKVALADPHALFRAGLRRLLAARGVDVVAEAADAAALVEMVDRHKPELVLAEVTLPGTPLPRLIEDFAARHRGVHVILLTDSRDDAAALAALRAGAAGYVTKDSPAEEIVAALAAAVTGGSYIAPRLARQVLASLRRAGSPDGAEPRAAALSDRELEVLRLIAQGRENAEIAEALLVSVSTAKSHVASVIRKLGVHNRVQAAVEGVRSGLV